MLYDKPKDIANENKDKSSEREIIYDIKKRSKTIKENEFNVYQLGKKEIAEKHIKANRPNRPHKKENENEKVEPKNCPCCNLPIGEPFNTCDNPEEFSVCGIGVSLYFSSIKFIIFIMFFVSICIGILNIYYSYKCTSELTQVCNIYYKTQNLTEQNYTEECKYYFTQKDEYFGYFESYALADTFFFRFSSVNIKDYRDLYHKINTKRNKSFEHSIINISLVNFICFIVVFLFNLFSIFYLFNKNNSIDYLNHTPSDYSIFLYNLDYAKEKFKKENENINYQRIQSKVNGRAFDEKSLTKSKLGFVPSENMKEIKKFKKFIENKICKGMFGKELKIYDIVLCYKLKDLIELQEKLEEKKK